MATASTAASAPKTALTPARAAWRPAIKKDKETTRTAASGGNKAATRRRLNTGGASAEGEDKDLGEDAPMAEAKAKVRRGGRRRRHQGGLDNKTLKTNDKALRSLLLTLIKMVCRLSQQTRQIMGAIADTFIIPTNSPIAKSLQNETANFAASVNDWRLLRDQTIETSDALPAPLGPPTDTLFYEFLTTLAAQDVGGANRETINQIVSQTDTDGPKVFNKDVHFIKLEKIREEGKIKLVIVFTAWSHRSVILDSLAQLGAARKVGAAPAGWLEDELSEWIDALSTA